MPEQPLVALVSENTNFGDELHKTLKGQELYTPQLMTADEVLNAETNPNLTVIVYEDLSEMNAEKIRQLAAKTKVLVVGKEDHTKPEVVNALSDLIDSKRLDIGHIVDTNDFANVIEHHLDLRKRG